MDHGALPASVQRNCNQPNAMCSRKVYVWIIVMYDTYVWMNLAIASCSSSVNNACRSSPTWIHTNQMYKVWKLFTFGRRIIFYLPTESSSNTVPEKELFLFFSFVLMAEVEVKLERKFHSNFCHPPSFCSQRVEKVLFEHNAHTALLQINEPKLLDEMEKLSDFWEENSCWAVDWNADFNGFPLLSRLMTCRLF